MGFSLSRLFGKAPPASPPAAPSPPPAPPPTPRDPHIGGDYWQRWVEGCRARIVEAESDPDSRQADEGHRTQFRFDFISRRLASLGLFLYSGGYPIDEMAVAFHREIALRIELDAPWRRMYPKFYNPMIGWTFETGLGRTLDDLFFIVALDETPATLEAYLACCDLSGRDRLVDLVVARLRPGREIAEALAFAKRYAGLLAAVEAPRERQAALLRKAFQSWKRRIDNHGKPPDDLLTAVDGSYHGHWCWEAALVALVFGIDDSQVRDLPNYPLALVERGRAVLRRRERNAPGAGL